MYNDILFPTDGTNGAKAAVEHVRDLAEKYDATVHVLTVATPAHVGLAGDPDKGGETGMFGHPEKDIEGMEGQRVTEEELREQMEANAAEIAEQAADELGGVATETVVDSGDPAQAILDQAEAGIDMIVMGTHGREGLDRFALGSVAEKVVRAADVPVVTLRQEE